MEVDNINHWKIFVDNFPSKNNFRRGKSSRIPKILFNYGFGENAESQKEKLLQEIWFLFRQKLNFLNFHNFYK